MSIRVDQALVDRGLCESREKAKRAVMAGAVKINDHPARKPSDTVKPADQLALTAEEKYVSRGGHKLEHALAHFQISPAGLTAIDLGASTGGFTDVLLSRGAARVVALDVGHNQLDWKIRTDPRVVVIEHRNARELVSDWLPGPVDIVTIDVSFISLRLILPAVPAVMNRDGHVVALVKPQFEAGRDEVGRGGLVLDTAVHDAVLARVTAAAAACGLDRAGMTPSAITGATGNQEYFLHLRLNTSS